LGPRSLKKIFLGEKEKRHEKGGTNSHIAAESFGARAARCAQKKNEVVLGMTFGAEGGGGEGEGRNPKEGSSNFFCNLS